MFIRRALVPAVIVLCVFTIGCQTGAPAVFSDADKAEIARVMDESMVLANATERDWGAYVESFYAPTAMVLPPNAPPVEGRDAIEQFLASFPPITRFEGKQIDVDGAGNLAYVRGAYTLEMAPPGAENSVTDHGKYIEIWRKQEDGSWQVALDIFNSNLPVPEAQSPQTEE